MDFYVYDTDLNVVGIIDNYTSVIWTLRYNDIGDFEIYIKSTPTISEMCKPNYFIMRETDHSVMIIKSITQSDSVENGDYIIISGVSVESLLSQRVVWYPTTISGRIEECAYTLINDNCIETSSARIIPNLTLLPLKHFPELIEKTDFTGENILEAVKNLCNIAERGFKMTFADGKFHFEIYAGVDHSRNQNKNPFIIFDVDNISETNYINDVTAYKNAALIGGDGEGAGRAFSSYGGGVGFTRFETFFEISGATDKVVLSSKGRDELLKTATTLKFNGEISSYYTYGNDYSLGDIVQIENKNGVSATSRIIEIIQSVDESGIYTILTFSEWEVIEQ